MRQSLESAAERGVEGKVANEDCTNSEYFDQDEAIIDEHPSVEVVEDTFETEDSPVPSDVLTQPKEKVGYFSDDSNMIII